MKTKKPFGALAVQMGFATPEQVFEALEEQRASKMRGEKHLMLGLLMIELGIINSEQLLKVLQNYQGDYFALSGDAIHLAVRLRSAFGDPHKTIMFTSAGEGDGVSTVAVQVSHALALMDQGPILLIDMNFRSLSLHTYIKNSKEAFERGDSQLPGLSDLLEKKVSIEDAIHLTDRESFSLLPVGNIAVDFLSLLLSDDFSQLLKQLQKKYFILIDSSSILQYPDSAMIASHTDGVVIVLSAGKRHRSEVLDIKRALDALNVPILGVVLCEKNNA
jgi:Mrp family chromosome partitioning ATPase